VFYLIDKTLIIGHRANYPEKLREYYEEEVDGVEVDLRRCGDYICLRHGLTSHFTGPLGFLERFFSKIILRDRWNPSKLEELIDEFKGILILDIKEVGLEEDLVRIFKDRENTFFTSFKPEVALKIRKMDKSLNVGIITRKFNDATLKFLIENELNVASVHYKAINKEWIEKCHENEITIVTWTLDDPSIAKNFVEWGIDGIITNKPSLIIKSLKGY